MAMHAVHAPSQGKVLHRTGKNTSENQGNERRKVPRKRLAQVMMMKDDSVVIKCNGIERSNVNNSLSMARETCALFVRFLVISIAPPAWYDDNAKKERPSETRDETSTYTRPLSSKKKRNIRTKA